ncbi:hypothetical protein BJX66DRAFT_32331 [Aspergillus keveii]|uniref:Uncharacterized protein n=1 Tax=Aspergillus keveii TaxID=714993 RepID=A0ABR4FSZ5_9EURO
MGKRSRSTTAENVVECALAKFDHTKSYFSMDLSPLIYKYSEADARSSSAVCYVGRKEDLVYDHGFMQLLGERWMAEQEVLFLHQNGWQSHSTRSPNHAGRGRDFLKKLGRPYSHPARNNLKASRRSRQIEVGVGEPGISCILLPAHSRLQHLAPGEETRLIQLVKESGLMLGLARELSPKLIQYQIWYNNGKA